MTEAMEDEDLASVAGKAMGGTRLSAASWARLSHAWTLPFTEPEPTLPR